jgi:hypothetical protein
MENDPHLWSIQDRFCSQNAEALGLMHPRFYQHDKKGAFTQDEFMHLLGPDTSPRLHPLVQLGVIRNFSLPSELGLVAVVHDWGEVHPDTGDAVYNEAAKESDKPDEAMVRNQAIAKMFTPKEAEFLSRFTNEALDTSTELGASFKISERLGYLATIIRAYKLFEAIRSSEPSAEKLRVLASISSHALHHILPLQEAAKHNIRIADFMQDIDTSTSIILCTFDKPTQLRSITP